MNFAQELINSLSEGASSDRTKLSLLLISKALGKQYCQDTLAEAQKAYQGGELVKDGSRLRTLGGCFFARIPKSILEESCRRAKELAKEIQASQ